MMILGGGVDIRYLGIAFGAQDAIDNSSSSTRGLAAPRFSRTTIAATAADHWDVRRFHRGAAARTLTLLAALAVLIGSFAQPAYAAAYATGGSGLYKDKILWLTWGNGPGGSNFAPIQNGTTAAALATVNGVGALAVTCTVSNMRLQNGTTTSTSSYGSGGWQGDGLDDLYNMGGTGNSNQLYSGIRNNTGSFSNPLIFDLTCRATLNGVAYRIPGLVVADAEHSRGGELISASGIGSWRLIERFRDCAGAATTATTSAAGAATTLRMTNTGTCGAGPMGIAHLQFAPGAYAAGTEAVTVTGSVGSDGGTEAVALGLVLHGDFSDAPASYGGAGHMIAITAGGTALAVPSSTNVFTATLGTLATATTQPRFDASADPDLIPASGVLGNAAASVDDTTGIDDETIPAMAAVAPPATTYVKTLTLANTAANTRVCGWIDFNRNGTFEDSAGAANAGEEACSGLLAAGTASTTLTWTIPVGASYVAGASYVRFRIGPDQAATAMPTQGVESGEVEDYTIVLNPATTLTVTKRIVNDNGGTATAAAFAIATNAGALTFGANTGTATNAVYASNALNLAAGTYTLTEADVAGYTEGTWSCTGATVNNNAFGSGSITIAAGATAACEITNNDQGLAVTLRKTWSNAISGNAVNLAISGPNVTGAVGGTSTAPSASTNATASAAAGSTVTLTETFTTGSAANYATTLACTDANNANVAVTGSGLSRTITMPATAVTCTYANDRIAQPLNLAKTWGAGARTGHTAMATTTGGSNNATFNAISPTAASGAAVTVYAGDVVTLPAETFGGGATGADYTVAVACTGGSPLASGATGRQLTIAAATTATTCTYTNTPTTLDTDLSVTKTNSATSVAAGGSTTYTVTASNRGPNAVNGAVLRDTPVTGLNACAVDTCTGSGGAVCPAAPGDLLGAGGAAIPTLPANGAVVFTVTCRVN